MLHVIHVYSAFVWASFTRSVTLPVFILALFNIAIYWPFVHRHNDAEYATTTSTDSGRGADNITDISSVLLRCANATAEALQCAAATSNTSLCSLQTTTQKLVDLNDELVISVEEMNATAHMRYRSVHYRFLYTLYYVTYSVVGYLLSQTIRYPPLLDIIYLRTNWFYCFKVLAGIAVYHLIVGLSLLFLHDRLAAILTCSVCTVLWTLCFYFLLTNDDMRWQDRRSVSRFLFYFNLFLVTTLLVLVIVPYASQSDADDGSSGNDSTNNTLVVCTAVVAVVLLFVLRVTLLRNRRIAHVTRRYAYDKSRALLHRHWFGFGFEDYAEERAIGSGAGGNGTATTTVHAGTSVGGQKTTSVSSSTEEGTAGGNVAVAYANSNDDASAPVRWLMRTGQFLRRELSNNSTATPVSPPRSAAASCTVKYRKRNTQSLSNDIGSPPLASSPRAKAAMKFQTSKSSAPPGILQYNQAAWFDDDGNSQNPLLLQPDEFPFLSPSKASSARRSRASAEEKRRAEEKIRTDEQRRELQRFADHSRYPGSSSSSSSNSAKKRQSKDTSSPAPPIVAPPKTASPQPSRSTAVPRSNSSTPVNTSGTIPRNAGTASSARDIEFDPAVVERAMQVSVNFGPLK